MQKKLASCLISIYLLSGCVSERGDVVGRFQMDNAPFSSVEGADSVQPYLLGWQCSGSFGRLVHQLNGYSMYVSEAPAEFEGADLAKVSVQPPNWPCAYATISRRPRAENGLGPLYEPAWASGAGPFVGVFSVFPPLQEELGNAMGMCLSEAGQNDAACATRIADTYRGTGVSFAVNFPHATRSDTFHQIGFLMTNGNFSFSE